MDEDEEFEELHLKFCSSCPGRQVSPGKFKDGNSDQHFLFFEKSFQFSLIHDFTFQIALRYLLEFSDFVVVLFSKKYSVGYHQLKSCVEKQIKEQTNSNRDLLRFLGQFCFYCNNLFDLLLVSGKCGIQDMPTLL